MARPSTTAVNTAAFRNETRDGWSCIQLPRRVDVSNARAFVDLVRAEVDAGNISVIVDFTETEAIDSTALGALIQIHKALVARGGTLRLASVGDGVRRVLAITRVDRVFTMYASLDDALANEPIPGAP